MAGVAAIIDGPESDLFWLSLPWVYLDIGHPQKSLGDNLSPLSGGEQPYLAGKAAIIESSSDRFPNYYEYLRAIQRGQSFCLDHEDLGSVSENTMELPIVDKEDFW